MKTILYIWTIIVCIIVISACDNPTEVDDNLKKTSMETNISESSGMLVENEDSIPTEPVENHIIVLDTTNYSGEITGIIENYPKDTNMFYIWERKVFWFDAFKVEIDTLNKTISLNIDLQTNNEQNYVKTPSDRISELQIQVTELDYRKRISNLYLNSSLGGGLWSSYTVKSVNPDEGYGKIKTYSGVNSLAFLELLPRFKNSTQLQGLSLLFVFQANLISLGYGEDTFFLTYQLDLVF